MFKAVLCGFFLLLFPAWISAFDEAGVRATVNQFTKGWNAHDPKAMIAIWDESADLIDPWGKKGTNRRAVESIFIGDQKTRFKDTTLTQTIDRIRFLDKDTALVDVSAQISGPGSTLDHHVFWVLKNHGEGWKISAARPYTFIKTGKSG